MYKKKIITKSQPAVFKPRRMVIGGVVYNVDNEETLNKIKNEMTLKRQEQDKKQEEEKNQKVLIKRTISGNKNIRDIVTKTVVDPNNIVTKEERAQQEIKNIKYVESIKKPSLTVKSNVVTNVTEQTNDKLIVKTRPQKFINKPQSSNPDPEFIEGKTILDAIVLAPDPIIPPERKLTIIPKKSSNRTFTQNNLSDDNTTDNYFTKTYTTLSDQWYELLIKTKHLPSFNVKLLIKITDEEKQPIIHPIKIYNDMFLYESLPQNVYTYRIYIHIPSTMIDIHIVGYKVLNLSLNPVDNSIIQQNIDLWKLRKLNDLESINYYIQKADVECSEKFIDRFQAEYELFKNPLYFESFINSLTIPKFFQPPSPTKTKILYLVHSTLEYETYSYTLRTQQLLENFNSSSSKYKIICASRYGYPYDRETSYFKEPVAPKTKISNVTYLKLIDPKKQNFNTLNILKYLELYITDVIKLCINKNIKIIHATTNYWNGIVAKYVSSYLNIPYIYELRELSFESISLQRPEIVHSDVVKMMGSQEKIILNNASKVITLNNSQNENSIYDVIPDSITIAPNPDITKLLNKHKLHGKTIIGFIGTITPYQNLECILKCLKILVLENNLSFIIIGDGPHKSQIQEQVKSLSLTEHVIFLGKLPHSEALSYYDIFDICIYPKLACPLHEFKSSYKIREAMTYGKAIIAISLKSTRELITDGENGILCDPTNFDDLLGKIQSLIDDQDKRDTLGKNAQNSLISSSWPIVTQNLELIYDNILPITLLSSDSTIIDS